VYKKLAQGGFRFSVSCVRQVGNEFKCVVSGLDPASQVAANIAGGGYDVTYDGSHIIFQPSS
jgi:hypothetical protein